LRFSFRSFFQKVHGTSNEYKLLSRSKNPPVSHCPMSLDIPHLLSLYNEHAYTGGGFIAPMALSALPSEKQPSACLKCRSCEQVCPQQIKISEVLEDFSAKLGKYN